MSCDRCYNGAMVRTPSNLINRDSDILGGTPVFLGTRVPVSTLFVYLEKGSPLDEFLNDFPSVTRAHAIGVLKTAGAALVHESAA